MPGTRVYNFTTKNTKKAVIASEAKQSPAD
jgi:hypothetical protein